MFSVDHILFIHYYKLVVRHIDITQDRFMRKQNIKDFFLSFQMQMNPANVSGGVKAFDSA